MISKSDLEKSIIHECNVCKHLFTKLTPESYEYRPTPGQRSTTELLRYMAIVGTAAMKSMVARDWTVWGEYKAKVENMQAEEFPAMMDEQIREIEEMFAGWSEEDMTTLTMKLPWGEEPMLGVGLMDSVLKWLVGYRMQLFLYAKANGASEISTANCWRGMDWPMKEEKEVAEEEADTTVA